MLMPTQGPAAVISVTAAMLGLDIFVVALRAFGKRRKAQSLQMDDWFIIAALLLACGLATILFIGVAQHALGYPTPTLQSRTAITSSNSKITITARLQYIFLVISPPTLACIKVSILLFYRRIFVVDKRNLTNGRNMLFIGMMTIVGLWAGAYCFAFMFACKGHFAAWWTSAISLITKCVDTLQLFFSFAVSDFVSDVIILIIPIPMIWKLQLPFDRKLGVTLVFLLGMLATVASLIRMIWVAWARQVGFDPSLDEDLLITTSLFWNMLEVSVGIIAACLPTLRGIFHIRSVDSIVASLRSRFTLTSSKNSTRRSSEGSERFGGSTEHLGGMGRNGLLFITIPETGSLSGSTFSKVTSETIKSAHDDDDVGLAV